MLLEAGATESFGSNASIRADAGCRAPGTDPRADAAWTWAPAAFELDIANNDEYSASLVVNAPGSWSYTFGLSLDSGESFTVGDLGGAGSNSGLELSINPLGALAVVPAPPRGLAQGMAWAALGLLTGFRVRASATRRAKGTTSPSGIRIRE